MSEPVNDHQSDPKVPPARRPGSRKGIPNRATAARQAAIAASGLTPLDYMLKTMREADDPVLKLDAAKAAAPYVHPKLAQTQITGEMTVKAELKSELLDKIVSLIARVKTS